MLATLYFTPIQTHQSENKATHRHVIACVCIFVNPSCKYFTPIQTHQSEKSTHRHVIACVCMFVNPSCQYFTYIQTHQSEKATHRHVIACVCIFVNPSCQYFTKKQTHQSEKATHRHVIARVCILVPGPGVIVPKTRQRFTRLSWTRDWRVFGTITIKRLGQLYVHQTKILERRKVFAYTRMRPLLPEPWIPDFWCPFLVSKPAVGNSPRNLDESSDHGLGQRYGDIWMQSSGTGRYCSENSRTFQTT